MLDKKSNFTHELTQKLLFYIIRFLLIIKLFQTEYTQYEIVEFQKNKKYW